jgi:hypothetical protein
MMCNSIRSIEEHILRLVNKDKIFPEKEAYKKEIKQKIKKSFHQSGELMGVQEYMLT